jgi:TIR domain
MTHTITIAYASFNKAEANALASSIQKVYPEVDFEFLEVVDERSPKPSGSVVALVFDTHFNGTSQRTEWLTRWAAAKASVPLLPIAIDLNHGRPPSPISGIKSRFLGVDQNAILTSIGSLLGLALRRGENKLFISYRASDGKESAKLIHQQFAAIGYDSWLDEADDKFGDPNLKLGVDVQEEIESRLSSANGLVLVDTPDSIKSPWVRLEVELAVGRMIPIYPAVLHPPTQKTSACRFRVLHSLHRKSVIESSYSGTQLVIPSTYVNDIIAEVERFLCGVYQNRVVQFRELERFFAEKKWQFGKNEHLPFLHDAKTGELTKIFSLLACCSFEDVIFAPRVRAFIEGITKLAGLRRLYSRNVFLYPGSTLADEDLKEIVSHEVPEVCSTNTDLLSYNEAVARISAMAGGFYA